GATIVEWLSLSWSTLEKRDDDCQLRASLFGLFRPLIIASVIRSSHEYLHSPIQYAEIISRQLRYSMGKYTITSHWRFSSVPLWEFEFEDISSSTAIQRSVIR